MNVFDNGAYPLQTRKESKEEIRLGAEVLAVQILRFAEDGLWGRLSALGIIMIFISTALVVIATRIGTRLTKMVKRERSLPIMT